MLQYVIFGPLFALGLVLQIVGVIVIASYNTVYYGVSLNFDQTKSVWLSPVGKFDLSNWWWTIYTVYLGWNIAYNTLFMVASLVIICTGILRLYRNVIFGFACMGFIYVSIGASQILCKFLFSLNRRFLTKWF